MAAAQIVSSLVQGDEGASWAHQREGWDLEGDKPVCSWEGITCTDNAITSIDLNGYDLRATIPAELGRLSSLRVLDLGKNDLYGTIPNQLTKSLRKLETFNVGENNNLVGTVPTFPNSPNLQNLVLQKNRLHGTIPDTIPRDNPKLMVFDISHNEIRSTIPTSFVQSQSLAFWDMGYNRLCGSLPHRLGDMKGLKGLFLDDNELLGTIPSSLSRGDSKLIQLFMEHNRFSGTIPAGLADIPRLTDLFVDGNKFTGTVPGDLCKLHLNEDFYKGRNYNATDGTGSERDGCNSISCPVNTASKEGVYPCFGCGKQGFSPYLGHNERCYNLDERIILGRLYEKTDGPNWYGGSGWGVVNALKCGKDGVDCNDAGKVVNLTLSGMNLKGTIPEELGYLRHLRSLNLSNNALTGYLPSDLRFAPLESLDISGNKLEGFVPPMLCLTGDINGNGENGDFNCDVISCSAGTWSPIGRATHMTSHLVKEKYECKPCPGSAMYLGSKVCPVMSTVTGVLKEPLVIDGALVIAALVLLGIASSASVSILCLRIRNGFSSKSASRSPRSAKKQSKHEHELWYGDADVGGDPDDDSYPFTSTRQRESTSKKEGRQGRSAPDTSVPGVISSLLPTFGGSNRDVAGNVTGTDNVAKARNDPQREEEDEEELWCLSDVPKAKDGSVSVNAQTRQQEEEEGGSDNEENEELWFLDLPKVS